MEKGISIVIPTWNGKGLLERFLPSVAAAAKYYHGPVEIIVVDDASADDTQKFLNDHFQEVKVLRLETNHGYGDASNYGVGRSRYDIVVLLNNDVLVKEDFLTYIPEHFEAQDIFALRLRVFALKDKEAIEKGEFAPPTIWIRGEFKNGLFHVPALPSCLWTQRPCAQYQFNVGAGAFVFYKPKWLQLEGFDDLFKPFYAEETDLAYRALKRGWKIAYEPRSIAYHQEGHATISKAKKSWYIRMVGERNRYFLVWKNIAEPRYLFLHWLFVPLRLLRHFFSADLGSFLGFFYALFFLRKVFARRWAQKKQARLRDREIFDSFKL